VAEIELVDTPTPPRFGAIGRRILLVPGQPVSLDRNMPFLLTDPKAWFGPTVVQESEGHPPHVRGTDSKVGGGFLNGRPVYLAWLVDGDVLSVGQTRFRIHSDYTRDCTVCGTSMRERAARGRERGPVFPCEGCLSITDDRGFVVATGAVVRRVLGQLEDASSEGRMEEEVRRIKADRNLGWLLWTERIARAVREG
jgi:hypothetical protein